jgi:hypothetical protein
VTRAAADPLALAAALDLDVHALPICLACLCDVSFAIDGGDERDVRRTVGQTAPHLWSEGLALPARKALERARVRGIAGAEAAIADVERRGVRSPIARAIVRRLGEDLLRDMDLPSPAAVLRLYDDR